MRWLNARLRTRAQAVCQLEPLTLTLKIKHICSSSQVTIGWSTGMTLSMRASAQNFTVRKNPLMSLTPTSAPQLLWES